MTNLLNLQIENLVCTDFNIKNLICFSSDEAYQHTLTFTDQSLNLVKECKVYLVSETPFVRLTQKVLGFTGSVVTFSVNNNSVENTSIKYIEIEVTLGDDTTLHSRTPIKAIEVIVKKTAIPFELGNVPLLSSNLLYPRIRLGFPQWGTAEKNDISNTTKIFEPLFTPFYDSYHKIIKYNTKSRFTEKYKAVQDIVTYNRPVGVRQYGNGVDRNLFEGSSPERAPQFAKIIDKNVPLKLVKKYLYEDVPQEFPDEFNNTLLYIKRTTGIYSETYLPVTILGLDVYDELLVDTVFVTNTFYSITTKRFKKITEIKAAEPIVIANFVNCLYDHYVIKDHKTPAPIVDNSLFQFTPYALIAKNNEGTRNTLQIFNMYREYSDYAYKFDLEYKDTEHLSFYIDEHLRIVWSDRTNLYSSVLGHDLSKNIGNHPSINCNNVVVVADQNTSIGDWAEATIDVSSWIEKKPLLISIKNRDTVLYYDQETEGFGKKVTYFYPKEFEKTLTLTVKVANEDPYIFSVITDDLKTKYLAVTHSNKLHNYLKDVKCSGDLMHIDGKLQVVGGRAPSVVHHDESFSDKLRIVISPKNVTQYDWTINIKGHVVSSKGSTLPDELFNVYSGSGNGNSEVVVELDRYNLLRMFDSDEATFKICCYVDPAYSLVKNLFEVSLNDKYGTVQGSNEDYNEIDFNLKVTNNTKEIIQNERRELLPT